jgi:hypothetical protein
MYIWGPGDSPTSGVDELLVQIDPRDTGAGAVSAFGGKPWFALSDAQGDVIALLHKASASAAAEVAAQWTYSPYGEVLTYEQFHPHPVVVFGHKSLVVDRLDTPSVSWDTELGTISDTQRLIPGAKLIAYARNRTYSPSLGRWLQQDPNASGLDVLLEIVCQGSQQQHSGGNVSIGSRLEDGVNVFAYARSGPVTRSDPTGLLVSELVSPYATIGMTAGQIAYGLVSGYADRMDYDADWASDWAAPDDAHSRLDSSWIDDVYAAANINGTVNDFANPLSVSPGLSLAGITSEIADWNRVVRGYNKVGKVGHHVISWYKKTKARLEGVKTKYGFKFSPWEMDNLLPLDKIAHKGRHKDAYHTKVFEYIERRLEAAQATGDAARAVFLNALNEIKGSILKNPEAWFNP